MAKRRAEDTGLNDSPSKRCYRSLCCVDLQLESVAPVGVVNPPSLLALLGSRCRKRKYYSEEKQEEPFVCRKTTNCDTRKVAASVLTMQTSGSFPDHSAFNSFQYWRVPLPELDLSLLEDTSDHSQSKEKLKVKDTSSDAMET
uniref:Putative WW-binding domain-containing protein n=1 Tax=Stegastes partitus TaxID=144197 RepID=A0A3B5BJ88_9TELE